MVRTKGSKSSSERSEKRAEKRPKKHEAHKKRSKVEEKDHKKPRKEEKRIKVKEKDHKKDKDRKKKKHRKREEESSSSEEEEEEESESESESEASESESESDSEASSSSSDSEEESESESEEEEDEESVSTVLNVKANQGAGAFGAVHGGGGGGSNAKRFKRYRRLRRKYYQYHQQGKAIGPVPLSQAYKSFLCHKALEMLGITNVQLSTDAIQNIVDTVTHQARTVVLVRARDSQLAAAPKADEMRDHEKQELVEKSEMRVSVLEEAFKQSSDPQTIKAHDQIMELLEADEEWKQQKQEKKKKSAIQNVRRRRQARIKDLEADEKKNILSDRDRQTLMQLVLERTILEKQRYKNEKTQIAQSIENHQRAIKELEEELLPKVKQDLKAIEEGQTIEKAKKEYEEYVQEKLKPLEEAHKEAMEEVEKLLAEKRELADKDIRVEPLKTNLVLAREAQKKASEAREVERVAAEEKKKAWKKVQKTHEQLTARLESLKKRLIDHRKSVLDAEERLKTAKKNYDAKVVTLRAGKEKTPELLKAAEAQIEKEEAQAEVKSEARAAHDSDAMEE